jgi:transposase InsO family protein
LLLCERVLGQGWTLTAAAEAAGVSVRTAGKWLRRYRQEGADGLLDASSAPGRVANRTPEDRVELIALLRRGLRMTAAEIAETLLMPVSTVSGILTRIGIGSPSKLESTAPANRYQKQRPGELVHIDVKKLARIDRQGRHLRSDPRKPSLRRSGRRRIGFEFVHIAIDDATRLAYVEVLEDEKARTAVAFLARALDFYRSHGVGVERVMTDNGPCYLSLVHATACRTLGLKHVRTRPYRPRTNGKAERFIRTLLAGWAYAAIYRDSRERRDALPGWLDHYNRRRPHRSLSRQTPAERLTAIRNNVLGSYTYESARAMTAVDSDPAPT